MTARENVVLWRGLEMVRGPIYMRFSLVLLDMNLTLTSQFLDNSALQPWDAKVTCEGLAILNIGPDN